MSPSPHSSCLSPSTFKSLLPPSLELSIVEPLPCNVTSFNPPVQSVFCPQQHTSSHHCKLTWMLRMSLLKDLTRHMTLLFSMMSREPPLDLPSARNTSRDFLGPIALQASFTGNYATRIHRPSCSSSVTFSLLPSAHLLNFCKACSTPSHRRPNRSLLASPHHTSYTSPVFSGTTWLSCFGYSLRQTS